MAHRFLLVFVLSLTTSVAFAQEGGEGGGEGEEGGVPVVEHSEVETVPVPPTTQAQTPAGYGQPAPQPAQPQPGYQQPYQEPSRPPRRQRMEYHEGMQIPPGGEIITRRRMGLLIPGVVVFGVFYFGTVGAWALSNDASGTLQDTLLIPVVGPFIAAGRTSSSARRTGAIVSGLFQTVGLGLFIGGLVPKRYVVYYAGDLEIRPHAGLDGGGLDLTLRF